MNNEGCHLQILVLSSACTSSSAINEVQKKLSKATSKMRVESALYVVKSGYFKILYKVVVFIKQKKIQLLASIGFLKAYRGRCRVAPIYFGVEQLNMRAKSINSFTICYMEAINATSKEGSWYKGQLISIFYYHLFTTKDFEKVLRVPLRPY